MKTKLKSAGNRLVMGVCCAVADLWAPPVRRRCGQKWKVEIAEFSEVPEQRQLLSATVGSQERMATLQACDDGVVVVNFKKLNNKKQTFDLKTSEPASSIRFDNLINGKKKVVVDVNGQRAATIRKQQFPNFARQLPDNAKVRLRVYGANSKLLMDVTLQFGARQDGNSGGTHSPTGISLSQNRVVENAQFGTIIGQFSTTDADADDRHRYTLIENPGSNFTINGTSLQVSSGASLDFESDRQHQVKVRTTDSTNGFFDNTFTIDVSNANEAPQITELLAQPIYEGIPAGTVVATVSTTDPDLGDRVRLEVSDARFRVNGNEVVTRGTLAHTGDSLGIRVTATDNGGLTAFQTFQTTILSASYLRFDGHIHPFDHFGAEGTDPHNKVLNDLKQPGTASWFDQIVAPGIIDGVSAVLNTSDHGNKWPDGAAKLPRLEALRQDTAEYNAAETNGFYFANGLELSPKSRINKHVVTFFADGYSDIVDKFGMKKTIEYLESLPMSGYEENSNEDSRHAVAHFGKTIERRDSRPPISTVSEVMQHLQAEYGISRDNKRVAGVEFPKTPEPKSVGKFDDRWVDTLKLYHSMLVTTRDGVIPMIQSDGHTHLDKTQESGYRIGDTKENLSPFSRDWMSRKGSTVLMTDPNIIKTSPFNATVDAMDSRSAYVTYDPGMKLKVSVVGQSYQLGDRFDLEDRDIRLKVSAFDGTALPGGYQVVAVYGDSGEFSESAPIKDWVKTTMAKSLGSGEFQIETDKLQRTGGLEFLYFAVVDSTGKTVFDGVRKEATSRAGLIVPQAMTSAFLGIDGVSNARVRSSEEDSQPESSTPKTVNVTGVTLFNKDAAAERSYSPDHSGQRSLIQRTEVRFDADVSELIQSHHIKLTNVHGEATANRIELLAFDEASGQTTMVVYFGHLADGDYQLVVDGGNTFEIGKTNERVSDGVYTRSFRKTFGDADGDHDVDRNDLNVLIDALFRNSSLFSLFDRDSDGVLYDEFYAFFKHYRRY